MTENCALRRWGCIRGWASAWAALASVVCAIALWRYAVLVDEHASEIHKIFSYAPDGVIVCNEQGSVVYANDSVKTITGFSELDLRRGGVEQVIPPDLRDMHRDAFANAVLKSSRGLEGINYQRVMPVQHKNGAVVRCVVSVGNIRHTGGPHFFAFIMPLAPETSEHHAATRPGTPSVANTEH